MLPRREVADIDESNYDVGCNTLFNQIVAPTLHIAKITAWAYILAKLFLQKILECHLNV